MRPHLQRILILVLLMMIGTFYPAQPAPEVDSLLRVLKAAKEDTNKVWTYAELLGIVHEDTTLNAEDFFEKGMKLAGSLKYVKGEFLLCNTMGSYYKFRTKPEKAFAFYMRALKVAGSVQDKQSMGVIYNNLGNLDNDKGKYTEAIADYMKALRLFEEIDNKKRAAAVMMSIGNAYADLGQPEKAIEFYRSSLKVKEETGDKKGIVSIGVNMGSVYYDLGKYDTAMIYFQRALQLSRELEYSRGIFTSLNNISEILTKQKKYKEALVYMQESLEIRKKKGEETDIAHQEINIGYAYAELKDFAKALTYIESGLSKAEKSDNWELMAVGYDALARCYELKGEVKRALDNMRLFMACKDSLLNRENSQIAAETEAKYQNEKKTLEIARNKAELALKNREAFVKNVIIVSIIAFVVLLVLAGAFYYRKKKIEQEARHNAELAAQKEMRTRAVVEAEEKERRRIAQDLHDGVGQILSAAKLNLSALESKLSFETAEQEDLYKNAISLVDDSVKEVRQVSHNMMPNTLIKLGLASAIREFITKIGGIPNLKVDLEISGLDTRLDEKTEVVLYRVIQEAVNNIIKHAKANHISLQLIKHDHELVVMVEDNGKGFDTTAIHAFEGIGLKNIISRIEFIGGRVDFDSAIGNGTSVVIEVPV